MSKGSKRRPEDSRKIDLNWELLFCKPSEERKAEIAKQLEEMKK